MLIQAAVVEAPGGPFTLRELELDEPRSDEILVRITAAGICHTDLSMRQIWPTGRLPMVFGHEGAGVVEAVGEAVTSVAPGDSVCLTFRSCGTCESCASGHPAYCSSAAALNAAGTRLDGSTTLTSAGNPVFGSFFGQSSLATHVLTSESNTIKVAADLPPAVVAPLGCSVQTGVGTVFNVLQPAATETLVVFGAGSVGLSAVMAAVSLGCATIAVDPVASRRALARDLGALATIDPTGDGDVAVAVRDAVGGGAHHAMDTTGRPDVIQQSISALRRRGALALVGIGTAEFPTMSAMTKGIQIHGVIEGDATPAEFIPRLLDLYREGRLPVEKLVSEFSFADVETAAQAACSGKVVKPVLRGDAEARSAPSPHLNGSPTP